MQLSPKNMLSKVTRAALLVAVAFYSSSAFEPTVLANVSEWSAKTAVAATNNLQSLTNSQRYAQDQSQRAPAFQLAVSLVWEGRAIQSFNVDAIEEFRNSFSDLDLVHFVSPAYFAREDQSSSRTKQSIQRIMRPGDGLGVLVSGWQSTMRKAGLIFRNGPTFWANRLSADRCQQDCGQEVPVHIYPRHDVQKLLSVSRDLLQSQGWPKPEAMMVSGWVASPAVLAAAARSGIKADFSPVPPELIRERLTHFPLYGWVNGLWANTTPNSQPQKIAVDQFELLQVPQNMAAIDYLTPGRWRALINQFRDQAKTSSGPVTVHMTFYQETAHKTLPLLKASLQELFAVASREGIAVNALELPIARLEATHLGGFSPSNLVPPPLTNSTSDEAARMRPSFTPYSTSPTTVEMDSVEFKARDGSDLQQPNAQDRVNQWSDSAPDAAIDRPLRGTPARAH